MACEGKSGVLTNLQPFLPDIATMPPSLGLLLFGKQYLQHQ